jgi:hypothetical protein
VGKEKPGVPLIQVLIAVMGLLNWDFKFTRVYFQV